jgi:outer membrane protein OmpA-like peptidoglycan-associated protein
MWKHNLTARPRSVSLSVIGCLAISAISCGKREQPEAARATTTVPATTSVAQRSSAQATPPASATAPPASLPPAASTDIDAPTPLPAKEIRGTGIKKGVTYYYGFNASPGPLKVTATAKNEHAAATYALNFDVQDVAAKKLCGESSGNTTTDKTMTATCQVEKAEPLILRLDLSEDTIDYAIVLDGPIDLPSPQATTGKPIAGAGSTDIDEPTRLTTNRIKGQGIKKPVSYYYAFNAGPGELTLTADGKNEAYVAVTEALGAGLYTLRAERLCEAHLGNTSLDKRVVVSCKLDKRQPVILRIDLSPETVDFGAKFDGPYDFNEFTPPKEVTIALDAAVLFDTGKSILKPEARQTLHEAAERVKKFTDAPVAIAGHTDNVGSDASNQLLSEQRANAVLQYFTSQESIPATRLTAKGYGESQPVADNATEQGRARNRRVEIVISPKNR